MELPPLWKQHLSEVSERIRQAEAANAPQAELDHAKLEHAKAIITFAGVWADLALQEHSLEDVAESIASLRDMLNNTRRELDR